MTLLQALLLGLVEGLTEYLPVSSTGHLLITQRLLGIPESEAANAFAIAIQAGAILAVLGLYRRRFTAVIEGLLGRNPNGRRLLTLLVAAFVPAAIIGKTFEKPIERFLFGPWPIVAAWAAGALVIFVVDRRVDRNGRYDVDTMPLRVAAIIGLAQSAALWPGVSRSLSTIVAALLCGVSMASAVEFSFLLGLLTLGAATAYKSLHHGGAMLHAYGPLAIALGLGVAWLSAWLSVRFMVRWLSHHGLSLFGYWRLIGAAVVALLVLHGVI